MTRLCFLDTETTGLQPHHHELWEVAVITRDVAGDRGDVEKVWHVRPDLTKADPTALRIGRYYERTAPLDAWRPDGPGVGWDNANTAAGALARVLDGAHVVASNPAFDMAFLQRFLYRHGQAATWHYHLVDVGALALGYLHGRGAFGAGPAPMPWSTERLGELVGVPAQPAGSKHTALGDARWVRDVYDRIARPAAATPSVVVSTPTPAAGQGAVPRPGPPRPGPPASSHQPRLHTVGGGR